jgi:MAF protein
MATETDERTQRDEDPIGMVRRLSLAKARATARYVAGDALVVGADTTVVCNGLILGKPHGIEEAREMLMRLRGRTHEVHSGLSVLDTAHAKEASTRAVSAVRMRKYSDREIEAYIVSGDPFDKAGAYAVQHAEFRPAQIVIGCYANVMGLPLCHLVGVLRTLGYLVEADIPASCQSFTGYRCTVFAECLNVAPNIHVLC